MKKIEPEEMSIDHTLKTSTRIEIPNSRHEKMSEKKKTGKAFLSLFIGFDEGGHVATFCLTPNKSLDVVKEHLEEVRDRSRSPKVIHTGKNLKYSII